MKTLEPHSLTQVQEKIRELEIILYKTHSQHKKTSGTYYTPEFIVKYMVNGAVNYSILKLINRELSSTNKIGKLEELFCKKNKKLVSLVYHEILPRFTICDIAMGWGVFILQAYEMIFKLYLKCATFLGLMDHSNKSEVKKENIGQRIIVNNIYGADISPQAIELAKFKLYEKALILLGKEKALLPPPNFVLGNSLLGYSFDLPVKIHCSDINKKWFEDIQSLIDSKYIKDIQNWITNQMCLQWGCVFPKITDSEGFSVIVGNPPYINVKRLDIVERRVYSTMYETYNANGDLSNVFWERSLSLLKDEGVVCFITPRYWFEGSDSDSLREFLLKNSQLIEIIDFRSNRTLFNETENYLGVDTAIVSLQKTVEKKGVFNALILKNNQPLMDIDVQNFGINTIDQNIMNKKRWNFSVPDLVDYIDNIAHYRLADDKKNNEFSGICDVGKGCSTGNNRVFRLERIGESRFRGNKNITLHIPQSELNALRALIKNSDIDSYCLKKRDLYWIFLKNKSIKDYPTIHKYLSTFRTRLDRTQKKYRLSKYYDYAAYRSLSLIDSTPKILTPYQAVQNKFALYTDKTWPTINETDVITLVIKHSYLKKFSWHYLLAILNSALIHYYVKYRNKQVYYLYDFRSNQIANFPICHTPQQEVITSLSKILMHLKSQQGCKDSPKTMYGYYNTLINYCIFEIYFRDELSSNLIDHLSHITMPKKFTEQTLKALKQSLQRNQNISKDMQSIGKLSKVITITKDSYLEKLI